MKRWIAWLLVLVLLPVWAAAGAAQAQPAAKYVFMFIGDGMGWAQVAAARYYLGAMDNPDAAVPPYPDLSFTGWRDIGLASTFDAQSAIPDSASAASAMASGIKTMTGTLNYAADAGADDALRLTGPVKLIAEYAKEAGRRIGVITSVSLNHATPAAYYAKSESRRDFYDIGTQALTGSTLDFLGGGRLYYMNVDGQPDVQTLAAQNGWTIVNTASGFAQIADLPLPVLAINPDLADSGSMAYEIDRLRREAEGEDILSLADIVSAGIAALESDDGFFIMIEGGKIDWAGHGHDAAASIWETLALSDAVAVALAFAGEHPDETLLIVTGDHETGGLYFDAKGDGYPPHIGYLQRQTISHAMFTDVVAGLRDSQTPFANALAVIEQYFGLQTAPGQPLSLTADELDLLRSAYALSMLPKDERTLSDEEEALYSGYEPLALAARHILDSKAGLYYSRFTHSARNIPVYAYGVNADLFGGIYDNTAIFLKTMQAMGLQPDE